MTHRYRPCNYRQKLPPLITIPNQLSTPDADALIEWLHDVACAIEEHYADALEEYHARPDPRQQNLWPDRDPPF